MESAESKGTIWTGIIFEMSQVKHMASTSTIIHEFFMKSRVYFPQSTMNNN